MSSVRRKWAARGPYLFFALITGALAVLPLASRLGLMDPLKSFSWWASVLVMSWLVVWVGVVMVFFKSLRSNGIRWISVGLVFASIYVAFGFYAKSFPPINDISNTPRSAPEFNLGSLDGSLFPFQNVAIIESHYPQMKPFILEASTLEVFETVLDVVTQESSWQIADVDGDRYRLYFVEKSLFFGFVDDVVVEISDLGSDTSEVRVRSRSRQGVSDLGVNARRIDRFLSLLRQRF